MAATSRMIVCVEFIESFVTPNFPKLSHGAKNGKREVARQERKRKSQPGRLAPAIYQVPFHSVRSFGWFMGEHKNEKHDQSQ